VGGEGSRVTRLGHAELTREPGVDFRAPAPLGLPLLELRDLGLQLLDAVAAVLADRPTDRLALGGERTLRVRTLAHACRPTLDLGVEDRKSTRLNSSHVKISYAVFCLKKQKYSRLKVGRGRG